MPIWLELRRRGALVKSNQILNFSAQQRLKQQAEFDKQLRFIIWLLDSTAQLGGKCTGGSSCAGWALLTYKQ
ncbi:hypothetical protein O9992_23460 [Vibrio lentus]|nr:hypothetical protein [Vibrio lentus]